MTNADPFDQDNSADFKSAKEARAAIQKERADRKNAEKTEFNSDDWEEVSSDIGERVEWRTEGEYIQGTYLGPEIIELPEEQHKLLDDGELQTTAIMHVFETANGRESCWDTYQLKEILGVKWLVGQYGRVEYVGSRKAKQGSVKRFKVLVRKPRGSAVPAAKK